jgi:hypothetical protein
MRSADHARIGAVVGAIAVPLLARGRSLPAKLALWCYGVLASVFVDLDHFAVARLRTGDWSHLRRAIGHPIWAFTRQEEVFPDVEITVDRLISHVLVTALLVVALRRFSRTLAAFTAVVLPAHILADLVYEAGLVRRELQPE